MAKSTRRTRPSRMRTARMIVQSLFFVLFLAACFGTSLERLMPRPEIFFALDPLVGIATFISSRQLDHHLFAGLAVLVLSMLFGRWFCGWVCPMGSCVDIADKVTTKHNTPKLGPRWLKQALLVLILVSALFSVQLAYLLDPMAIASRALIQAVQAPLWTVAHATGFTAPWLSETQPYTRLGLLSLVIFIAAIGMGKWGKRFWCRNICPLGGLFGITGRWSLWKRRVDEESCTNCQLCRIECKMAAIPQAKTTEVIQPECILCYNCVPTCGQDATEIALSTESSQQLRPVDLDRRRVLGMGVLGVAVAGVLKTDISSKLIQDSSVKSSSPWLIRPPGSQPESLFLDRCIRCGLCTKICPTHALHPAVWEAGIEGFESPILIPRIGYCIEGCNACADVCPTGAIKLYDLAKKYEIRLGQASVDHNRCMAWADGRECLVCGEHCGYQAIKSVDNKGTKCPVVDRNICVGCGQCENRCPIQPEAAIRVRAQGDNREERYTQHRSS